MKFIKKMINLVKHPSKIVVILMDKGILNFLSDKSFLKLKFKLITGYKLNLKSPETFNEKIQWLKLYDRKDIYTIMVDKCEAKKYVSNIIGNEYIIPTIGVYNNYEEINFEKLPNQFVIKPTHTSGNVFICKDKNSINHKKLRKTIKKWLKRDYYKIHREWPYKNIKHQIIIEEYKEDKNSNELKDYKFFCFNGEPNMLFVAIGRPYNTKFNFYDLNFEKLPIQQHYPNFNEKISKPANFDKMIEFSKKLSKNIPHVRVDFYDVNGKLYFGELTFYHFSGFENFNNYKYDLELGDLIKLPERTMNNEKEK